MSQPKFSHLQEDADEEQQAREGATDEGAGSCLTMLQILVSPLTALIMFLDAIGLLPDYIASKLAVWNMMPMFAKKRLKNKARTTLVGWLQDHLHAIAMGAVDDYTSKKCPLLKPIVQLMTTPFKLAIWPLMNPRTPELGQPVSELPEVYLAAAGECFGLMLIFCAAITFTFNPSYFETNPLKSVVGYNNVCVGFDSLPARLLGVPMDVMTAHFAWKYVQLDNIRTKGKLLNGQISEFQSFVGRVGNYVFGVFCTMFPLLLIIVPSYTSWPSTFKHFSLFVFMLVALTLESGSNLWLFKGEIPCASKVWFGLFVFHAAVLFCIGRIDINAYQVSYEGGLPPPEIAPTLAPGPPVPWFICAYFDYGWFFLMFLTIRMLPNETPVVTTYTNG